MAVPGLRWLAWTALLGGWVGAGAACSDQGHDVYRIDLTPEADLAGAPYTGWTRAHYEAVFGRLCVGWLAHRKESLARVDLPRPGGWAEIEGVSRMLPAVGAWLADPENPDVIYVDDEPIDLVELSVSTMVALTDPENDERWPELQQTWFQGNVEAAYVAQFLVQTRTRVWDRMTLEQRNRMMGWMMPGNSDQEVYTTNWNLFPAMRNVARAQLGYPVDPAWNDEYLDQIEEDYLGDGWYGDGETGSVDWYNSFVLHPEMLFWARWEGERDPERKERIERRARAYLSHLPYLFAPDGRTIPWGRSLAYRTAILAPLAFALQADLSPNRPGLDRRIVSGNLSYHMGGDPASTGMMINDLDIIPMGYLGEDFRVREGYISAGSTYFATRALQVLALPRDHEFWTAVEEPLPVEHGAFERVMPAARLGVFSSGGDEPLTLWNGGNQKSETPYSKLNYSSHFPFQRVNVDKSSPYDSALSVSPDGSTFWERGFMYEGAVAPGFAFNRSAFEHNRGFLTQVGLGMDDLMVHVSCVDPGVEADARGVRLFEGSYPIAIDPIPEVEDGMRTPEGLVRRSGELWEYARSSTGNVMIAALWGFDMTLPAHAFKGRDDINLIHRRAVQPAVATRNPTHGPQCAANLQLARIATFDPQEVRARVRMFEMDEVGRTVRVGLDGGVDGGGSVDVWASMVPFADPVEVEVAGFRFTGPLRYARVEREGRRLVAAGVRSIVDPEGVVVFEPEAGLGLAAGMVEIELDARRIVTDVPGYFGVGPVRSLAGLGVDGQWTDRTTQIVVDGKRVLIPAAVFEAHATAFDLTTATFRTE